MAQARDKRGRFLPQQRKSLTDRRAEEPNECPQRSKVLALQRRDQHRPDGWTDDKRTGFLTVLSTTCNVSAACRAVDKSPQSAYVLRNRDATFRRGWRAAISQGYARLEVEMLERALIAEERVRGAIAEVETDREVLDILSKHPQRVAELLYRVHRQTALEFDGAADEDPDGEQALAEIRERVGRLRERIAAELGAK